MTRMIMVALLSVLPAMAAGSDFNLGRLNTQDIPAFYGDTPKSPPFQTSSKIFGGENAQAGEFPFMVALLIGMDFCGGSLIAEDWVLTAAHCINGSGMIAIIGATDPGSSEKEQFRVDKVIVHPLWSPQTYDYDFALVHLPERSRFPAIALNRETLSGDIDLVAAGWGLSSASGGIMKKLQKVTLPLVSTERCSRFSMEENAVLTDRMMCAGIEAGGQGMCFGDSGGPLILDSGGKRTLVGVTSWGHHDCAEAGKLNAFGKVSAVADWIERTTAPKRP